MPEVRGGFLKASYVASGNLAQYRFVSTNGVDAWLPTTGAVVTGVTLNHPNNNEEVSIVSIGHGKVLVANSLGSGIAVMTGNTGFAVQATSGQFVAGILLSAADSGLPASVLMVPGAPDART